LAIEMVIKITDDFKIHSEVKRLHIARLGSINVEVIGLSHRFARVIDQLVKIGVSYLRRHLEIVIGPLTEVLNGLLLQFAPDDLTTFLL